MRLNYFRLYVTIEKLEFGDMLDDEDRVVLFDLINLIQGRDFPSKKELQMYESNIEMLTKLDKKSSKFNKVFNEITIFNEKYGNIDWTKKYNLDVV